MGYFGEDGLDFFCYVFGDLIGLFILDMLGFFRGFGKWVEGLDFDGDGFGELVDFFFVGF